MNLARRIGAAAQRVVCHFVDTRIPFDVVDGDSTKILQVPRYSLVHVPPLSCSKYARMAAEDLFGIVYKPADAWNHRYDPTKVVIPVVGTLEDLAELELLHPGMLVGIKNPNTSRRDQRDLTGELARYTHIGLYIGQEPKELQPVIAHQYGAQTLVVTQRELFASGLVPKEIISLAPKNPR